MRTFALILAAAAASTLAWPTTAQSAPIASEQRMAHISVVAMGRGSPVVLIPGLSSPRSVWAKITPALAVNHKVYLVQINGFGGDDPGANLSSGLLDGVVGDLHSYLAAHHGAPARVIGHSMGGLIALMLAKTHPGDTAAVMTVDALPYVGDIFVPDATVAQLEPQAKTMREQMIAGFGKPNPAAAATAKSLALTATAQQTVADWMGKADARVAGEAMYEDLTTDLRPDMVAITTPITLVYPFSDAMPKARADAFYRAEYGKAAHVTFVPVAGSGHFVMLDQPAAFAAAVEAFVR